MTAAPLAIALGEYDTGWHDAGRSLLGAGALVERAARAGARLVALPETALSGFTMDAAQAVPLDSPSVDALRALARRHEVSLVAGVALREDEATPGGACVVNAALVVDRSGEIVAVHRKRRLFAYGGEHEHYRPGADETVVAIDGVRIGVFICYELRFPELFAAVAPRVDAMIVIANWPRARRAHWDVLLRARAIESQCAVIGVNRTGSGGGIEYDGGSAAWSPWGEPLAERGAGVRIVTVDPAEVARVRERYPFLRDRATA